MTTTTRKARKTSKSQPKFSPRVRFNWGYHDAALAVEQGWAVPAKNFGFGPAIKVETPADVLARHQSKDYARGWTAGYEAAMSGQYANDSTAAWDAAKAAGIFTDADELD